MGKPLTYLSLKCVVEHLEANKRIHIATRCPALRKIERKIPLRLDSLTFAYSSIKLNNITFQLYSRVKDEGGFYQNVPYTPSQFGIPDYSAERILLPGDISLIPSVDYRREESAAGNRSVHPIYLYFEKNFKQYVPDHRVPENLEFHVALKRLTSVLLGTRTEVFVKRLEVVDDIPIKILRLPPGLKLKTQELEVHSIYFKSLMPLINTKSLNSLKLKGCLWNSSCFELPIVQSVQKLYIKGFSLGETSWSKTLLKLPNRDITLDCYFLSIGEVRDFIQELLDKGRDIGTCYTIDNTVLFGSMFEDIAERFGVEVVQELDRDLEYTPFSLSIPMTATTELRISGNNKIHAACTTIEVVPIPPKKEKQSDGCWMTIFLITFCLLMLISPMIYVMFNQKSHKTGL